MINIKRQKINLKIAKKTNQIKNVEKKLFILIQELEVLKTSREKIVYKNKKKEV